MSENQNPILVNVYGVDNPPAAARAMVGARVPDATPGAGTQEAPEIAEATAAQRSVNPGTYSRR